MKILKLTGVKLISKIAQKEINGGSPNSACCSLDKTKCMVECINAGNSSGVCYLRCLSCC
ncbi:hypothetical protein IWQ47_003223 [Aquimarina sp. EL_43]|uniref:hypothetical protein n=1 Tax=Aquimarina TaxID=290174 RepID=UPI00126799FB|nr:MULTISPECIES: hypothetical protein [Aquimarina]MBG6132035.1 hypothetical protein [Aquimarina sp. EL_35]MBG6149599.1 hypothetical protein [Aquimarina sp. EL_32]MBG6170138.1 hypothetical protein [Aquimarina sp. EL_43]